MPIPQWFACFALAGLLANGQATPPQARKAPVADVYHGVKVVDEYRWLEDWSKPETQAWSDAQNAYARQYLDALPARATLHKRLTELISAPSANFWRLRYRGGKLFALQFQPPKEQPFLVEMDSPDAPASARVVLDPAKLDPSGHTAIDFYVPSRDGKYVAVSLSKGGSESGDLHIFEVSTGKALPDIIARVNGGTAGGSIEWTADGSGLFYTRYPRRAERAEADLSFYQQVWFHRLGTNSDDSDTYSIGKDFPRIAEISLSSTEDGKHLLATVANGDGGELAHYLRGPDGNWTEIARLADQIVSATFGDDGFLYLVSLQDAPKGKLLKLPLREPRIARAKTIVPEGDLSISQVLPAGGKLYVAGVLGGPSEIRVYSAEGSPRGKVQLEANSAVYAMVKSRTGAVLFQGASFVTPPTWYRINASSSAVTATALRSTAAADFSDIEVSRQMATSRDGTQVPLTILRRKGTPLNGKNPVLLTGYGGYRITVAPFFNVTLRPLFDRGVVYAVANLRGGGEYGEKWHQAGSLTRKQNVFDDFEACARFLIDNKYTSPAKLAIMGGSNGGLLMGAALTQHPELYAAVVSEVGIYDMLRVELSPNGAFNVTEFGTVKEPEQFRAMFAYSPYHHVQDGTQYPAILFTTGANDPRVDPMHSRKMIARLQASGTTRPVLLRTSSTSGHGIGTALSETIEQATDVDSFLFAQWGME